MKKRVLLAEDNPEDRIPLAKYLQGKDWDVTEVLNPEQAIEEIKENEKTPFDVLILDLIMPEDNPKGGEQVLKFVKQMDARLSRTTPVILATAYGYNGPAQAAKAAYPNAVKCTLTKSFALADLLKAMHSACRTADT